MNTTLAYGKKRLSVDISDRHAVDIVEPVCVEGLEDAESAIDSALRHPVDTLPLSAQAKSSDGIGIVFSDITRPTPYRTIMPVLLHVLRHIPDNQITLFCATGTHRKCSEEELNTILGPECAERFEIVQNDVRDPDAYQLAGTTASGNAIYLHKALLNCDLIIPTGYIEPHFFAGFSGGGKAIMPGMASLPTIRRNHSIANLESSKARWGITTGNPIWEEVMQAAALAGKTFLLNVTLNRKKEITGVFAGDLRQAHRRGCTFEKSRAMVKVSRPYDIVVTSNSGYPLDLNVYQSVKGISAAAQVVKPGGAIVIASECWDGIPAGSDYEKILSSVHAPEELDAYLKLHEQDHQDTWQVFLQSMIQQNATVYLYSDQLADELIRKTLFHPVNNINELVEELAEKAGPGARICVLPEGPHTIPYVETG